MLRHNMRLPVKAADGNLIRIQELKKFDDYRFS